MNNGMLSQDEIDALLKIGEENDEEGSDTGSTKVADFLSTIEEDTLGEIGNISFGSSATTLSTLLSQKVDITTPEVSIITKNELSNEFEFEHVTIQVSYVDGFNGQNVLVMKSVDAAVIADIMLGGDGTSPDDELNDIHLSAVQEAMNQMMGTAATSMSTVFGKRVDISPPSIKLAKPGDNQENESMSDEAFFVKVSFQLKVGNLIDSNIMQLIPVQFAKELVNQLLNTEGENEAAVTREMDKPDTQTEEEPPLASESTDPQFIGDNFDQNSSSIQQASFSNLEEVANNKNKQRNLNMLLDIPLKVSVELGRTKRSIKDILDLSSGSVIELDKLAGEPVDILANEKLIARGEVVVIEENFGVRITDVISQSDRLMKLK